MLHRTPLSKALSLFAGATLLACMTARAHHIRGIPHYSYQDNYPQAPLHEEFRDAGPWSIQFTFWEIPSQKALDLAVYVKRTTTDRPYEGGVQFRVFRDGEEHDGKNHPFIAYANPRNIYKVGWVYEEPDVYYAEVVLGDGEEHIQETFRFQLGKVPPNYWLLGTPAIGVVALAAIVAILKKRATGDVQSSTS